MHLTAERVFKMICTYQDYAEEVEVETSSLAEKLDQEVNEQIVFPVKLHQMLDEAERQGITHSESLECVLVCMES